MKAPSFPSPPASSPASLLHKAVNPVVRKLLPKLAVRPYGMHPLAWAIFIRSGVPVSRIGQCIGHALASKGTHGKTGVYRGADYGACFDLHVLDLTHEQAVRNVVMPLSALGIVVFLRVPGADGWPSSQAYHAHCIYPGCNMTVQVAHQVQDWLATPMLNGLARHLPYNLYSVTSALRQAVIRLFAQHKIVVI